MESVKSIRAIERAFEVLTALQDAPRGATLVELSRATSLSGPTLLRILKTLIAVKAVRRSMVDQRYRNSVHLKALVRGVPLFELIADAAATSISELLHSVEWPSDLVLHAGNDDYMTVVESNLRRSRFHVKPSMARRPVNLLGSASGIAFLSALRPERRMELARHCAKGNDPTNLNVTAAADLEKHIERARIKAYAVRHQLYQGGRHDGPLRDDGLSVIAVPVVGGGVAFGALTLYWNRKAVSEKEMARKNLDVLQAAAARIADDVSSQSLRKEFPWLELADGA